METLGTLIDKLSIINIKIWHIHDIIYSSKDDKIVAQKAKELLMVNAERNKLIEEIDLKFKKSLEKGEAEIFFRGKLFKK